MPTLLKAARNWRILGRGISSSYSGSIAASRTTVRPPESRRSVNGISSRYKPVLISVLLIPKTVARVRPFYKRVKRIKTTNRELLKLRRTTKLLDSSMYINNDSPVLRRALSRSENINDICVMSHCSLACYIKSRTSKVSRSSRGAFHDIRVLRLLSRKTRYIKDGRKNG
jgi:hypothetical protein